MLAFAHEQFGHDPSAIQPTPTSEPEHLGRPEPVARTVRREAKAAESPVLALVVLIGVAIVILQLASRAS